MCHSLGNSVLWLQGGVELTQSFRPVLGSCHLFKYPPPQKQDRKSSRHEEGQVRGLKGGFPDPRGAEGVKAAQDLFNTSRNWYKEHTFTCNKAA